MYRTWLRSAAVRAVKTVAQTAVALLTTGVVGILDVDWLSVASASLLAGVVSVLTSLTGLPEVGGVVELGDGSAVTGVLPASANLTEDERENLASLAAALDEGDPGRTALERVLE